MTPEELLKRRKKVMVDFPQWSVFKHKKGDVLELMGIHFVGKGTSRSINENEADKYPEVLREMEWWEERETKDMPEYVKFKNYNHDQRVGRIIDIRDSDVTETIMIQTNILSNSDNLEITNFCPIDYFLPATKGEYENEKKVFTHFLTQ